MFSGKLLRFYRHNFDNGQGLTMKELAKRVGCTITEIHKYEHGITRRPEPERIAKLAEALHIKPTALEEPTGNTVKPSKPANGQVAETDVIDWLLIATDEQRNRVIFTVQEIVARGLHLKREVSE